MPARPCAAGVLADTVGLSVAAAGAVLGSVPLAALGLFVHGVGIGVWDVAMNVEAAEVERRMRRTVMPRFHAGWSAGSLAGAGLGVVVIALGTPMLAHLLLVTVVVGVVAVLGARGFLPAEPEHADGRSPRGPSAWRDPRTLAIGLMVLCFAMVEGTANDWLALGLIDGYGVAHWVGVAGFATFVVAMTAGRLYGPRAAGPLRATGRAVGERHAGPRSAPCSPCWGRWCRWSPWASCCGVSAPRWGYRSG